MMIQVRRGWRSVAGFRRPRERAALSFIGWWVACLVVSTPICRSAEPAAQPIAGEPRATDVAALRAAAAAYRDALAQDDAAAIRRMWTADGDVVDSWGNLLSVEDVATTAGRPAGEARPEIRMEQTRFRFITPDVALEDGTGNVVFPGVKKPLEGWFTAIWARRDGAWKLAGIREAEHPASDRAATVEDLEWMVGDWVLAPDAEGQAAPPTTTMTVRWDAAHSFLLRDVRQSSAAAGADDPAAEVQQRIGWDPLVGRIRSWSFATDGSRSEATWFRDGTSWVVKGVTIQHDGTQTTTVNIYTYDGKDRCTWRMMEDPLESTVGLLTRATWVRQGGPKR
jgi:hypothetical protein